MTLRSIGIAFGGLVLLLLAWCDALRAQQTKPDILVQIKLFQNGSDLAEPNIRLKDGQQTSVKLPDGTEIQVKASTIDR
jgi:hypothetical protein